MAGTLLRADTFADWTWPMHHKKPKQGLTDTPWGFILRPVIPNVETVKNPAYVVIACMLGVVAGGTATYELARRDGNDISPAMGVMDHSSMVMGSMTMEQMNSTLAGKTGEAFDKAFLETMIQHHEGAVEMAKRAQKGAVHPELKTMADGVISAQTDEIEQMRTWQKEWGY